MDERSYYGEDQATLSLKELIEWAKERNQASTQQVNVNFPSSGSTELPTDLAQSARRYNITLCPTIYPSIGPFISSLVRSGVAKYSAFRLIDTVALYDNGTLKPAAATKEDIFKDKSLSLIEKRRVMKFVMAANADSDAQDDDGALYMMKSYLLCSEIDGFHRSCGCSAYRDSGAKALADWTAEGYYHVCGRSICVRERYV